MFRFEDIYFFDVLSKEPDMEMPTLHKGRTEVHARHWTVVNDKTGSRN